MIGHDSAKNPQNGRRPGGYDGAIESGDGVVAFLYLLLRDELAAGRVEELVLHAMRATPSKFSNDFVAAYAIELAARLRGATEQQGLDEARRALGAAPR